MWGRDKYILYIVPFVLLGRIDGSFKIWKRKEESDFVLQLQIPGETQIPGTNLKICCTISGENEKNSAKEIPQKSYTKCFDYDIIKSSLCVRYRRPGDYFTIDGEGKKKKLKKYSFIRTKCTKLINPGTKSLMWMHFNILHGKTEYGNLRVNGWKTLFFGCHAIMA